MLTMRYRKLAMVLAAGALIVGAAGTSTAASTSSPDTTVADTASDGTAAGGGDAASGLEAARAVVEQYRDPNQPIGVTIPLTGVPEKKTIAWLECELESCPYITVGMQAA